MKNMRGVGTIEGDGVELMRVGKRQSRGHAMFDDTADEKIRTESDSKIVRYDAALRQ